MDNTLTASHQGLYKSKYNVDIMVSVSSSGKTAKVSVEGRKPLTYKKNAGGNFERQGQTIEISGNKIHFV